MKDTLRDWKAMLQDILKIKLVGKDLSKQNEIRVMQGILNAIHNAEDMLNKKWLSKLEQEKKDVRVDEYINGTKRIEAIKADLVEKIMRLSGAMIWGDLNGTVIKRDDVIELIKDHGKSNMEKIIRLAVEGGYKGWEGITKEGELYRTLLQPLFWQCLEKGLKFGNVIRGSTLHFYVNNEIEAGWHYLWHYFIDWISEGKDINLFFEEIIKTK